MAVKTVFTIPPDAPFLDVLAQGLLTGMDEGSLSLADQMLLLPTRRACLHLREAFQRHMKGGSALLPRMQPLGDPDEDELYFSASVDPHYALPPPITPLRRQMLLAQLISQNEASMPLDQAALLAEALGTLLDEVQVERGDLTKLATLVEESHLASHWQKTVEFLGILTQTWPSVLAREGALDPVERRNRVIAAQAAAWRADPPPMRIVAAGSTGSMPATAELLDVIASLPNGAVILPGLDQELPEDAWKKISESHPQYGMKKLLEQLGVKRQNVRLWPGSEGERRSRARLLQESMRPADTTETWRELGATTVPTASFSGLTRVVLDHPQEEAQAIALIMRQTLETPGKNAAFITSDRALAQRVSQVLRRWDIRVNDSGGTSLTGLPVGGFLIDVLKAAAPGATTLDHLALFKHPLAAFGLAPALCRTRARRIEIDLWRNPNPGGSLTEGESEAWLQTFKGRLQPLAARWHEALPLPDRIAAHVAVAESIAASDETEGATRLWAGEEGEAAATWLDAWRLAGRDFKPLTGSAYIELCAALMRDVTVRPGRGLHPRLSILGPLEARLIQTDVMILGGLNEGVWPPEAKADPWMSRPMKKDFGLPLPERRIGLSAHDFVQLASAPEVILTRASRLDGAPSVPSRFLLQLEAVLRAAGHMDHSRDPLAPHWPWREWARLLDQPERAPAPCPRPEPRPPVALRPQQLSVTDIGTWRRNPYAIYARHILKLKALAPLDVTPNAQARGSIIHAALDSFVKAFPADLPDHALQELLALGRKGFSVYAAYPEVEAFWWPRFERIAKWFVAEERLRRLNGIQLLKTETQGLTTVDGFSLKGRADRIDRNADGSLAISDYKTGGMPTEKEVLAGYEPQLPLLALIAAAGGFEGVLPGVVSEIAHWKLDGGRKGSEIKPIKADIAVLMMRAQDGLSRLVRAFADPATPYEAVPKPQFQPRRDDYAHLARLQEWGRTKEDQ
ncbi:MAG: double-strand break repair protein AddB [Pseudomonadota bacterium]|nr:double-strand break repair protein AddB [Pseudomonadota bacterium]